LSNINSENNHSKLVFAKHSKSKKKTFRCGNGQFTLRKFELQRGFCRGDRITEIRIIESKL